MKIKVKNIFEYNTNVKQKNDEISAFRYAKAFLKRWESIDLRQECIDALVLDKHYCSFCEKLAKVEFDLKYDRSNNILYINDVNHITRDGMIYRYCAEKCPGNNLNPNSKEFVSKVFNLTYEEANDYILNRNDSPFYCTNYSNIEDYKESQKRDKDFYIKKYGEYEGVKKYNEIRSAVSKKNAKSFLIEKYGYEKANEITKKKGLTINHFIQKYGEAKGEEKYNEWKDKTKQTLSNFIIRYGEERGKEKYNEHIRKKSYVNTLNYYIEIYGEEKGKKEYKEHCERIKNTLDNFIIRYGKKEGKKRYEEYRKKLAYNIKNRKTYSNESIENFEYLINNINLNIKNIKWKENEKVLWDYELIRPFFYDLYFEYKNKKIIIEYDTPIFHPNKKYMTNEEFNNWKPIFEDTTPLEIYKKDEYKKDLAKKRGFFVFTLYNKNGGLNTTVVDDLITEIKNYI